jgi:hypothetical protein
LSGLFILDCNEGAVHHRGTEDTEGAQRVE